MSKTASGYGRLRRARFAYRPVSGDRKSGIPAAVEMPAPTWRGENQHVFEWRLSRLHEVVIM